MADTAADAPTMTVAGIDFSTKAIDVVLLDEDTDAATWHRFVLAGQDAFERTRSVKAAMPSSSFWDDVLAVGIEQPRGRNALVALGRVQGAVLACIPASKLVQPWNPSSWRQTVGLKGNCSKDEIRERVWRQSSPFTGLTEWDGPPQDACDAYCIALATRKRIEVGEAA